MYFTDISNQELQYFRNMKVPNFTIKLTDLLTSGLFQVEEIITDSVYRIFPLFYTGRITSSNPSDHIIDNKVIVCKKETNETFITFISNPDEEIQDYNSYGSYFSIGDNLTTAQFNSIVGLLLTNTSHKDSFRIKQGLVTGEWADYAFDIDSTTIVDNGILITDETLSSLGTVMMTDPKFHYTTYTLKLKVYHMTDINVCEDASDNNVVVDTLSIVLVENEAVTIPFNTLDYSYIVGLDATVELVHDIPVIPDLPKHIYLSADKPIIQTGEKSDLTALVKDIGGVPVGAGHDVYFYEEYEPYSISLTTDKSIIQSGDKADLTATLKDEDGSLVAEQDIYFYQQADAGIFYIDNTEYTSVNTSGENVVLLPAEFKDLPEQFELSFDMKITTGSTSTSDCRFFIGEKSRAIPTNPQQSVFIGKNDSAQTKLYYGYRTNETIGTISEVAITGDYQSCKIVRNGNTFTYYQGSTILGTNTFSWFDNYSEYVLGLVAWGTATIKVKNVKLVLGGS